MEHTIPPPTLPQHGLNPRPRRSRSRPSHGSQSSASERVPPEDPGYEPSVSDGDREFSMRRPPIPPLPSQNLPPRSHSPFRPQSPSWITSPDLISTSRGPESPTMQGNVPRSEYAQGAHAYPRHGRYDSASRWSPNSNEDTPARHKPVPTPDMAESPLRPSEERRSQEDSTQRKSRPRTPQDILSPPHYPIGRPYVSAPRNPLSGGMNESKNKRKNGRAVQIPMTFIDRGTYDSAASGRLHRVMKSNPNLRGTAFAHKDYPPILVPGRQPSRPPPQPPLPPSASRPSTSTGETSTNIDTERERRGFDPRRAGMSPATPSGRTITSPPYGSSPSSRTPISPEPFSRPRSAQDKRTSPSHASVSTPRDDRTPARSRLSPRYSPHVTSPNGVVAREDAFIASSPADRPMPVVGPPPRTPPLSPAVPVTGTYVRDPVARVGGHRQVPGDRPQGERTVLPKEAEAWAKLVDDSRDGTVKPLRTRRPEPPPDSPSSESDSDGDFFMPPANPDFSKTPPANLPTPAGFPPPPSYSPQSSRGPHPRIDTGSASDVRRSTFDDDSQWAPRPPPEAVLDRIEHFFKDHDLDRPVIEMPSGGTSPTSTENLIPAPQRNKHKKSIRVVAAELKKRASRMESSVPAVLRKRNTKLWGSKVEEVTTEAEVPPMPSEASPGGATARRMCASISSYINH